MEQAYFPVFVVAFLLVLVVAFLPVFVVAFHLALMEALLGSVGEAFVLVLEILLPAWVALDSVMETACLEGIDLTNLVQVFVLATVVHHLHMVVLAGLEELVQA